MRALISTWDKTGLDSFARGLVSLGWRLVASGNTAAALEAIGLPVEHVEDVTASPEMLGGRVKTLHPRVHAGILARRDEADDVATLEEHGIEAFDLVCVNLYPFEEVTARQGVTEAGGGRDDRRRRPVDAARRGEELRPLRPGLQARAVPPGARGVAHERRALARDPPPPRGRGVRAHRRLRGRDRDLVQRARGVPRLARPLARQGARPRLRREPAPARPRTTPSAAPAATSSRASSSCTGRSSPSTTSTTSRRPARSRASSPCRPA